MKLLKIFRKNSNHEVIDNFTFETIPLNRWIKASKGDLSQISKNGKINIECRNEWYKMQDEYLFVFGGDSTEMKSYKSLCFEYHKKLCEWIQNPSLMGRIGTDINSMYAQKNRMQKELFESEKQSIDYNELIAKVSISAQFRINPMEITAKEFFNIVKALNNGNEQTN